MRWSFFLSLVLTLSLAGVYWYEAGADQCPIPIRYRVGTPHPSFNLSFEEAVAYSKNAEQVWEDPAGRELFVYDPTANFTINFQFDERQADNNAEQSARDLLDREEGANDVLIKEIESLEYSYETLVRQYETKATAYERDLQSYNETVQRYNDQGGAPPEAFAILESQRTELATLQDKLTSEARELNRIAHELADASATANERIASYNARVSDYNTKFGEAREFTQGDYQGDAITIYTFRDAVELERVLAHEFGHALGIGHVEGTSSIMYYLMTEMTDVPDPSAHDMMAFFDVCGTSDSWEQRFRAKIRSIIRS